MKMPVTAFANGSPARQIAVAAVLLALSASGAPAQPQGLGRPAPAPQTGPRIVVQGHFLQNRGKQCPAGALVCRVTFPPVEVGKQLIITRVSCIIGIDTTNDSSLFYTQLTVKTEGGVSGTRLQYLDSILLQGTFGSTGPKRYLINTETLQLYNGGERPVVLALLDRTTPSNSTSLNCTIAGQIKP
jgi:hypothetical protein